MLKGERIDIKDADYNTVHYWLRADKPKPKLCERCKLRPAIDISFNGVGHSKDYNLNDYEYLCRSCHMLKDKGNGTIITKARAHRIREFYKCGITQSKLATLFKIGQITVSRIINYQGIYEDLR